MPLYIAMAAMAEDDQESEMCSEGESLLMSNL